MLIGIFSDAHGNEPGFFECYNFLAKHADSLYYLGDVVGYFPLSNKIIDTLRTNNIHCLKGNHDAMLLGELRYESAREKIYQIANSRNAVSKQNFDFLRSLAPEKKITIDNRSILFVHGSPWDPLNGYVYPDGDVSDFEKLPYDVIFMGHTHRAFIKKAGKKTLINVGSCGLPRDTGNKITICLYDTIKNEASIKNLEMDIREVIKLYGVQIHPTVHDVLNMNNKIFENE